MNIYTSVEQLIGKTPLLELCRLEKEQGLNIIKCCILLTNTNGVGQMASLGEKLRELRIERNFKQKDINLFHGIGSFLDLYYSC